MRKIQKIQKKFKNSKETKKSPKPPNIKNPKKKKKINKKKIKKIWRKLKKSHFLLKSKYLENNLFAEKNEIFLVLPEGGRERNTAGEGQHYFSLILDIQCFCTVLINSFRCQRYPVNYPNMGLQLPQDLTSQSPAILIIPGHTV